MAEASPSFPQLEHALYQPCAVAVSRRRLLTENGVHPSLLNLRVPLSALETLSCPDSTFDTTTVNLADLKNGYLKMAIEENMLKVYPQDKALRLLVEPIAEYPNLYILLQSALHSCGFAN